MSSIYVFYLTLYLEVKFTYQSFFFFFFVELTDKTWDFSDVLSVRDMSEIDDISIVSNSVMFCFIHPIRFSW